MGSDSSCAGCSPSRSREKSKFCSWFAFSSPSSSFDGSSSNSPKSDKNVFQRIKRGFEKRLPRYRTEFECPSSPTGWVASMSAGANNVTGCVDRGDDVWLGIDFMDKSDCEIVMEGDERRRALKKKWIDVDNPNLVMYRACVEMLSYAWYWGEISRHEAQRQLTDKPNGSFLIRDSEKDGAQFTLSFRMCSRTLHYRIQYRDNYWHFEARRYESMVDMVENFMNRGEHERFFVQRTNEIMPPFPVVLRYPLSRYLKFNTLQELCRRVIQKNIAREEIDNLPIPVQLKQFLREKGISGIQ